MLLRALERACWLRIAALAVCLAAGTKPAMAFDASAVVRLADGSVIDLGPHRALVERAVDENRLAALAHDYLRRGLTEDAAAILAYAVRYRPGRAGMVAEAAAGLAAAYPNAADVRLIFEALAAEPAMLTEFLGEALVRTSLPPAVSEAAHLAAGLALPAPPEELVTTGDVAGESEGSIPAGRNAEAVFGGSLLPDTLRIGGGAGAAGAAEPPADGGAS